MDADVLPVFEKAALDAGRAIMEIRRDKPTVFFKADRSPVTEADRRAEAIILAALAEAFPAVAVVAEEATALGRVPGGHLARGAFILVDPLDGTKEFVAGREEFTVNVALVVDGAPRAGVVYAPASGVAYVGGGGGAERLRTGPDHGVVERRPIACRPAGAALVALASRSHDSPETEAFLVRHRVAEVARIGSSLKFCLIAEGAADVYPRLGRTMEWDTAAGDAVLRAAGGMTFDLAGEPLSYGKRDQVADEDFANPFFVALGGRTPLAAPPKS